MTFLLKQLSRLVRDERGTEVLEWGLVCGLIVVGAIVGIAIIGPKVVEIWNGTATKVQAAPLPT